MSEYNGPYGVGVSIYHLLDSGIGTGVYDRLSFRVLKLIHNNFSLSST